MTEGKAFISSLEANAKMFAPAVRATVEANDGLCSWLLGPTRTLGGYSLRRSRFR